MHVYYKFGLFLIFILSVSTIFTSAAPATNRSASSLDDAYPDDYDDDYYDEHELNAQAATTVVTSDEQMQAAETTAHPPPPPPQPQPHLVSSIEVPKRSNHVLEPTCPKACLCLEDYKYIQCSNAALLQVPHDLPSTALIIDLSRNQIAELRPSDFANCTKVREINLSGNQLTDVPRETFVGLRRLQRLRLDDNRLTRIESDAFSEASALDALDLSNNSIELGSDGSFLNQPELLEFSCRNCNWTTLYDETFANLSGLTTLKLDQNDFNRKINTRAFAPLRSLIKLRLPELDQTSVRELCNVLQSIDNIGFRHFDISCFELVLGATFNESLIPATDAPSTNAQQPQQFQQQHSATDDQRPSPNNIDDNNNKAAGGSGGEMSGVVTEFTNFTLPSGTSDVTNATIFTAGVLGTTPNNGSGSGGGGSKGGSTEVEEPYQVPVSQEAINIMLISIMVIAVIGLIIGIICRKDVGGIKTKCCRTRKPEPKDQVHPAEEIPLNKLA